MVCPLYVETLYVETLPLREGVEVRISLRRPGLEEMGVLPSGLFAVRMSGRQWFEPHLQRQRVGSELLISWNLGRPKFVDQPEIRAGKDSFRGGEFLTQVTNRGVVGRLRQMMQTDRQRLGFEIGNQIDLGVVDLPQ